MTIGLGDLGGDQQRRHLTGEALVRCCSLLPGGRRQRWVRRREILLDDEGRIHDALLLPVDTTSWSEIACEVAGRNLTEAEWAEFGPRTIDYRPTCEQ